MSGSSSIDFRTRLGPAPEAAARSAATPSATCDRAMTAVEGGDFEEGVGR